LNAKEKGELDTKRVASRMQEDGFNGGRRKSQTLQASRGSLKRVS